MAILLIPIFAALGAFTAGCLALLWLGADIFVGAQSLTPERAWGLVITFAAAAEIVGWGLIIFEEVRHG